ncbi:MAG: hypothetical protein AAFM91_14345 [Pseudomonadota bacterium]
MRRFFGLLVVSAVLLPATALAQHALLTDAPVPVGRTLCVVTDAVLDLPAVDCAARQQAERLQVGGIDAAFDSIDLTLTPPPIDVELLEAVTVGARYAYDVGPSYRDNYFTRVDRYAVETAIQPGDVVGGLPVRIRIDAGSELTFAQQFASGAEARSLANTYTPDRLPLTATRARALKPGDYVRFDANLSLLATFGQLFSLPTAFLNNRIGVEAVASGRFQVHVFRLDGERIRLKLVAERERAVGGAVTAVPSLPVDLFAIDRGAESLIAFANVDRSVRMAIGRADNRVVLVDYTLNLADDTVAATYDNLFHASRRLRLVESTPNARMGFVGDLAEFDVLASESTAVDRNFKGTHRAGTRDASIAVALQTYDVKRERIYREKLLSEAILNEDGSETTQYYLLPTWSRIRERTAFFGTLDERMEQSAEAMFSADASGRPLEFINLGFTFVYADSILRVEEYRRIRKKIELLLPTPGEELLKERLEGTGWLDAENHRGVRVRLHYFFRSAAFDVLTDAGLDDVEIMQAKLEAFVLAAIRDREYPFHDGGIDELIDRYASTVRVRGAERRDPEAYAARIIHVLWGDELRRTAARLVNVLNPRLDSQQRLDAFVDLRWSSYYRRLGAAIWIYLMHDLGVDLKETVYVDLELDAQNREAIEFTFGREERRNLYEAVRHVESLLNDRSIDMRENAAFDSVIARMRVVERP